MPRCDAGVARHERPRWVRERNRRRAEYTPPPRRPHGSASPARAARAPSGGASCICPFFAHRPADLHRSARGAPDVSRTPHGWQVSLNGMRTYLDARPIRSPIGKPGWIHVDHPAERERVLYDEELLFSPGILELPIQPGWPVTIIAEPSRYLMFGRAPTRSFRLATLSERPSMRSVTKITTSSRGSWRWRHRSFELFACQKPPPSPPRTSQTLAWH